MYEELTEKYIEAGASLELVEKIFTMKKYDRAGFPEYVFNRMSRANPTDVDKWLKLSTRYCLKSFINNGKQPVITARRKINKRRSETMLQKKRHEEEVDNTDRLKNNFDNLKESDRELYYQKIRTANPKTPDFLIKLKAFLLYCDDIEQKQKKEII